MEVRNDYLKKHSGVCVSCQKTGNTNAKKHGDYKERLYKVWQGLFHRRYRINPEVHPDWHSYPNFKAWALENGYTDKLTIDRIDNNGNYEPSNCQWISREENAGKDRVFFNEEQKFHHWSQRKLLGMTQIEYAKKIGVSRNTIQRLEKDMKELGYEFA
jgi:hypothetical protein